MVDIQFHAIIEVLGKPKEHVESMLNSILEKIEKDERFTLKESKKHEAIAQENSSLFATFMEIDLATKDKQNMINFCFDYMPSSVEINVPSELTLSAFEFTSFLSDLQAKLHNVDMIAKQMKMERDLSIKNTALLMKNYILVLLNQNKLTVKQLSGFTGVEENKLADFLDKLIDEGKIDLEGEFYFRVK